MRLLGLIVCGALCSVALADTQYEVKSNELQVPYPVVFEPGTDTLKPEADKALDYVKGYLDAKTYISTLRIEAHTDAQGGSEHNQALSEKRALATAKALVAKGIDCKRLIAVGFGETKPVSDNRTAEGRAKNRRVVFANAALRGKAIGGAALDGGGQVAGDPCK